MPGRKEQEQRYDGLSISPGQWLFLLAWQSKEVLESVISWPTKDLSRQLAVSQGQKGKETNGLMSWQDIILKEVPAIGSSLLSTFLLHH